MNGSTVGRYQIIEEIGRGGMAKVYRAFDPRFKRYIAVKIMTSDLLAEPTLKARFEREAQTIAALEHPAIVPVYDFGEEEGRPYLVMRLMSTGTLSDRLRQGPLSIDDTVQVLLRIGSALERAHEKGIIHRDLKPSNIMFDDLGDAYLADFGIARLTESAVTLTGNSVIGTPAYMSPEQIHGDKEIDGRSDIYALGVICFEMLTGQRPYDDVTPTKIMMKHIMDPVPDIYALKPDLPSGVDEVINRTMAKQPEERFTRPSELTTTLATLARQPEPPAQPDSDEPEPKSTAIVATPIVKEPDVSAVDAKPIKAPLELEGKKPADTHAETEVIVPSFAGDPSTGHDIGAQVDQTSRVPETEIAVPAFGEQERKTKGGRTSRNRAWLFTGAIVGGLILIAIIAVVGGGIFLATRGDSGGDSGADLKATKAATPIEVMVNPTGTRRPEGVTIENQEPTQDTRRFEEAEAQLDNFYRRMDVADFDSAMEAINQAIELDPQNDWYFHEKAWLLTVMGELEMALREINKAIELDPEDPENYSRRGTIFRELDNWDGAVADGRRAVNMDSDNPDYHLQLGITYQTLGDVDAALAEINQAIEINPEYSDALGVRADAFRALGDPHAALADLERAIALNPGEVWHYDQLASVHAWELGELEAGLEYFNQAIEMAPHEEGWRFNERAIIFRELGEPERALADHEKAIALEPENSQFVVERAYTLRHLGNSEAALADFERAIALSPENSDAHMGLGSILFHDHGNVEGALEYFNRGIELDPFSAWKFNERELLYTQLEEFDAALADLGRCLELDPNFFWCYYDRAWLLNKLENPDGAIADFKRFLDLVPESECPECQQDALRYIERNS